MIFSTTYPIYLVAASPHVSVSLRAEGGGRDAPSKEQKINEKEVVVLKDSANSQPTFNLANQFTTFLALQCGLLIQLSIASSCTIDDHPLIRFQGTRSALVHYQIDAISKDRIYICAYSRRRVQLKRDRRRVIYSKARISSVAPISVYRHTHARIRHTICWWLFVFEPPDKANLNSKWSAHKSLTSKICCRYFCFYNKHHFD